MDLLVEMGAVEAVPHLAELAGRDERAVRSGPWDDVVWQDEAFRDRFARGGVPTDEQLTVRHKTSQKLPPRTFRPREVATVRGRNAATGPKRNSPARRLSGTDHSGTDHSGTDHSGTDHSTSLWGVGVGGASLPGPVLAGSGVLRPGSSFRSIGRSLAGCGAGSAILMAAPSILMAALRKPGRSRMNLRQGSDTRSEAAYAVAAGKYGDPASRVEG
ncbi:hypothetical protein [Actinoplanes sp. G11-F43]|uniref:hypothetical protein n=1 Tax=Actinoplanes sp. G11-F43 TaxID=3424130 RepID=UPI003D32839E